QGSRVAIGHADNDPLPDLAVSNGQGTAIRILRNLGDRTFATGEPMIAQQGTSPPTMIPLRLDPHRLLHFEDSRLAARAPQAGEDPTYLHDLGSDGTVVFTDIDGDGIDDVVAQPCPLGLVTGWGKVGANGRVGSWHILRPAQGRDVRDSSGVPAMGILTGGLAPEFVLVREGVPGFQ